jgi:hypothetical protein
MMIRPAERNRGTPREAQRRPEMPEGISNPNAIEEDPFDTEDDGPETDAKDSAESGEAAQSATSSEAADSEGSSSS